MNSFLKFLSKNKLYTAINLFGLAVSLMFVILIADYSAKMLGTDRFHPEKDRIFLVGTDGGYSMNYTITTQLHDEFPEIEKMCGMAGMDLKAYSLEENTFPILALFADSTFFDFFAYPSLYGDLPTSLNSRDKAVITQTLALKMFGTANAVGETIHLTGKETISLTVSAVIKDLDRTTLPNKVELITTFKNITPMAENDYFSPHVMIRGNYTGPKIFLMTKQGTDLRSKNEELKKYFQENDTEYKLSDRNEVVLTPLTSLMLDPKNNNEGLEHGSREMLWILLSAGIAILIFAVTNYINLTVAQTGFRAREMACRKLLGAPSAGITARLIGESTILTFVSFLIGLLLAIVVQDYASSLCQTPIDIVKDLTPGMGAAYVLFVILIGAISGIIPAYTLAQYKPIDIVRGTLRYRSKMLFSKIFLIFQNVITIALLVGSITIYLQINHLIKAPLGLNVERIIETYDWNMTETEFDSFKSELLQQPCVEAVGRGSNSALIVGVRSMQGFADKDGNDRWMTVIKLDTTAIRLMGLELLSNHRAASDAVFLNEAAAEVLEVGIDDPDFKIDFGDGGQRVILGGVFKNFRMGSALDEYSPTIIYPMTVENYSDSYTTGCVIYIKVIGDQKEALKKITHIYTEVTSREPNETFIYAEDVIARQFRKESLTARIILIFTIIAILISALGLFAMSTYFTRGRIKEIGIRKIYGGTRSEILRLQLWGFIRPILISIVLAIPLSYIVMDRWLQNYTYRIPVYPWIFIAAGAFIIIIGLLTVLGESLKAVNSNPIKAVKTE